MIIMKLCDCDAIVIMPIIYESPTSIPMRNKNLLFYAIEEVRNVRIACKNSY